MKTIYDYMQYKSRGILPVWRSKAIIGLYDKTLGFDLHGSFVEILIHNNIIERSYLYRRTDRFGDTVYSLWYFVS